MGASCTSDSDDCAEHAAYLERQLRLDRNIETACALMRSATLGRLHGGTDGGGAELPRREEVESAWRYVRTLREESLVPVGVKWPRNSEK